MRDFKKFISSKWFAGFFIGWLSLAGWLAPAHLFGQTPTLPDAGPSAATEGTDKGAAKDDGLADSKKVGALPAKKDPWSRFVAKFHPEGGLLYGPQLPLGTPNEVLNTGWGTFGLYADIRVPYPWLKKIYLPVGKWGLDIRTGLRYGLALMSTDENYVLTGKSRTMLVTWQTRVLYKPIKIHKLAKLEPFANLNFGMSFTRSEVEAGPGYAGGNASSVDGLYGLSLGTGVITPLIPVPVIPFFEISYFQIFESMDGLFLQFNLGAGWRF